MRLSADHVQRPSVKGSSAVELAAAVVLTAVAVFRLVVGAVVAAAAAAAPRGAAVAAAARSSSASTNTGGRCCCRDNAVDADMAAIIALSYEPTMYWLEGGGFPVFSTAAAAAHTRHACVRAHAVRRLAVFSVCVTAVQDAVCCRKRI